LTGVDLDYSFHTMALRSDLNCNSEHREMASGLPALDVFKFHREGALGLTAARVVLNIANIGELLVAIDWEGVNYGGARPWWRCPKCSVRRRFLRVKDGCVGCTGCFGLSYRSRYDHWAPSRPLRRAVRLRQQLGADTLPFSELPPPPRQHKAAKWYTRIAEEIRLCEREALGAFAPHRRKR
jgi:hypothetical protein